MKYPTLRLGRLFLILITLGFTIPLFAQEATASPPLPADKSSFWEYGIAVISPILVWLLAKIVPKIPAMLLPCIAPLVGLGLGSLLNWLAGANLSWVDMAKAGALAVFVREITNQLVTKRLSGEPIKTAGGATLLLLLSFGLCAGCLNAKRLESGGAYAPTTTALATNSVGEISTNTVPSSAPDMELYALDASFDFVYTSISSALQFERDNRAMLWAISPQIKHTLDKLRPEITDLVQRWARARQVYVANPTPANLSLLQTTLEKIRTVSTAVAAAIPARK